MRLVNFDQGREIQAGVADDAFVRPLQGMDPITAGFDLDALKSASHGDPVGLGDVRLHAPVLTPGKVICLGLNYRGHVAETKRELPSYPVLFTKFAESIIGPADDILLPPESEQVDYEAELAVVIGRAVRRASPAQATAAIAGYAIANDVTMRDYQYKSHQWLQGKTWPRSTPLGPWIVSPGEIGDASRLEIRLQLNGEEMQSSNTERMIFGVATTMSVLSEFVCLQPGDVILMGTPGGVGFRRDPQVFLRSGDRVRVEIEGIGAIENNVVAEPSIARG